MRCETLITALIIIVAIPTASIAAQDDLPRPLITVQNAANVEQVGMLGHGAVSDIAWSPDGKSLAVFTNLGIWLYDTGTFETERVLPGAGKDEAILRDVRIAWSPDSTRLAVTDNYHVQGVIRVLNVRDGSTNSILEGHTAQVAGITWSPDGTQLASLGKDFYEPEFIVSDNHIRIWDGPNGREKQVFETHIGDGMDVAWSPNGSWIAVAGDKAIEIWNASGGLRALTLQESTRSIAWSPDSSQLASADLDGTTVRLWDVAHGEEIDTLTGTSDQIWRVAWSPDGTRLAAAGRGSPVALWDLAIGHKVRTFQTEGNWIPCISWSPDSAQMAAMVGFFYSDQFVVQILDTTVGTYVKLLDGFLHNIRGIAWSPDSTQLAAASERNIFVWDVSTRTVAHSFGADDDLAGVGSIAWSPDGSRLAAAYNEFTSRSYKVRVWEVNTGQALYNLQGHRNIIDSVSWSPDGRYLASSDDDGMVIQWDTANSQLLKVFESHSKGTSRISWSPDGMRVAFVSGGYEPPPQNLYLWDASNNTATLIAGDLIAVDGVQWSPDGLLLATVGGEDIRIWEASSGREIRTLAQPETPGYTAGGIAWSPDSSLVAAENVSGIGLWDVTTGQNLRMLEVHTGHIIDAAWSPDGTLLATSGFDHTIRLWGIP